MPQHNTNPSNNMVLYFIIALAGMCAGYLFRVQIALGIMRLHALANNPARLASSISKSVGLGHDERVRFLFGENYDPKYEGLISVGSAIGWDTMVSADPASANLNFLFKPERAQEWQVLHTFSQLVRLALGNDIQVWLFGVTPEGSVLWAQAGGLSDRNWKFRPIEVPGRILAIKRGWYQTVLVETTEGVFEVWLPFSSDVDKGETPTIVRVCDRGEHDFLRIKEGENGVLIGQGKTLLVRTEGKYSDSQVPACAVYRLEN
jgi:hypothetical protein